MKMFATLLCLASGSLFAADAAEYPVHSIDEVIELARQHPHGVRVTVTFPIRKADVGKNGSGRGHFFLDSMENYRDPHSISVNVFPHSAEKLGLHEGDALVGKSITVRGVAQSRLVRCHNGCPQDPKLNHYYQTQILVREGDDVAVADNTEK